MTYMTVQQAAEAWGVTVRQVQSYCTRGRVPGAQKFGMAGRFRPMRQSLPTPAAKPLPSPGLPASRWAKP